MLGGGDINDMLRDTIAILILVLLIRVVVDGVIDEFLLFLRN